MTGSVVPSIGFSKLDQAIEQGLTYLDQHQFPNGEFCVYCAADSPIKGWCAPDSSVFPTALIAGNLLFLAGTARADEMLTRATHFLRNEMVPGGVWGHFTKRHGLRTLCPPDVDDTACVSDILKSRGIACPRKSNVPLLLSNRDSRGLFYTWFLLRPRWNGQRTYWRITLPELLRPVQSMRFWNAGEGTRAAVDGVVNANVLYYVGDLPETQSVIAFLLRIIADNKEDDCDLWYRDAHTVYYFFSRNYFRGTKQLEPMRQPIIDRIRAAARPDGRLGETVLDTATAACALLNLHAAPPELEPAINFLLRSQRGTGEWPRWLVYYGGPKKTMGWGSEEMVTGFCLEALARYQTVCAEKKTSR